MRKFDLLNRVSPMIHAGQPEILGKPASLAMGALTSIVMAAVATLFAPASVHAQTWTPISGGGGKARTVEVSKTGNWTLPESLAKKGGSLRAVLVGAGEGGWAARGSCLDYSIQGGRGGDGGEVLEIDIALQPGQCSGVLGVIVGEGGRGALRGGNSAVNGESGGLTTLSCSGTALAAALGGGRRAEELAASRSAKGGQGGALVSVLEGSKEEQDLKIVQSSAAGDGQSGHLGFGSGGGGGGTSVSTAGVSARLDGANVRRSVVRNAALGKGHNGAGSGAGPAGVTPDAQVQPAENAAQYGAGGGGGYGSCGINPGMYRDGGNGASGVVRFTWSE